ncbi:2-amino-4-hydroxy-6-hydroxymethyldihydropteridine diphosphokinase [Corynebacterium mendelii]|uniref:2-amino-4-hydroxy-6-hydroxymethyldihydropteridine diphosphokinase n=1 Tax=Corynebacterium mendelii TaxID=2765362 RepID=A0A939E264_9CORY|nr:2-amino-4-hydroxy-6-hydroxymethyldihydropteridine diphosphokinase [Corynebacterium mendelii]MBN9645090.1 2-amino-4-hydroxy-6-hydroxymethyldihydropteridine diphosphokinase [Corynebacterium mendelii]
MRAVISIGSNMNDRLALMTGVYRHFYHDLVAVSSMWATPPWGGVEQDEYLNAILVVDTSLTPLQLLREGQALEDAAERKRTIRWGPRTLDVDIVQCTTPDGDSGQEEILSDDPVLTLPHPWATSRAFVLLPWLEAEPDAQLLGRTVREWVKELDPADIGQLRAVASFPPRETSR